MKYGFIKVASCCPTLSLASPMDNAKKIVEYATTCDTQEVKILVTGELSLVGNTAQDLVLSEGIQKLCIDSLNYILENTQELDMLITVGLPLVANSKLFNVVAVLKGGEILGFVPKTNLSTDDSRYFSNGFDAPKAIQLDNNFVFISPYHIFTDVSYTNLKIGVTVGDEFDQLVPNTAVLRQNGASIILNSSANLGYATNFSKKLKEIETFSEKFNVSYILASTGLGESTTNVVFSGNLIIAENGEIIKNANILTGQDLIISEVDYKLNYKKSFDFSEDTQENFVNFFSSETKLTRNIQKNPFLPKNESEYTNYFEEIVALQAIAIAHRMKHIGSDKAIVAVSGGLDSTLTLLCAHKAIKILGKKSSDLIAITMPGFGTTDRTYQNALDLMNGLDADVREISIKNAVSSHFDDIGHDINDKSVVYENAQARERSQIGLDLANKENGLFIGTGDLSELCLGFATFAGDHIALYGVNASLPKTLMQYIVRYLSSTDEFKKVSKNLIDILNTPISPELLPTETKEMKQKTEDIVGPYELHDFFAFHYVFLKKSPSKVYHIAKYAFDGNYDCETIFKWLEIFIKRFYSQQFKRSCSIDGAKVLQNSLSPRGDLMMPSDALSNAEIADLYTEKN